MSGSEKTKTLDPKNGGVSTTHGIPRLDNEGNYWHWIFVNWETPEEVSAEKAKEWSFFLKRQYKENLPLEFRKRDKQFLYFKGTVR